MDEGEDEMPGHTFEPLEEALEPFLVALKNRCIGSNVVESFQPTVIADRWGASENCNCLWLGAGGSGKTYAYAKVLRPMFRRYSVMLHCGSSSTCCRSSARSRSENTAQMGKRQPEQWIGPTLTPVGKKQRQSH